MDSEDRLWAFDWPLALCFAMCLMFFFFGLMTIDTKAKQEMFDKCISNGGMWVVGNQCLRKW